MVRPTKALPEVVVFNAVRSWLNTPQGKQGEKIGRIWVMSEAPEAPDGGELINQGFWTQSGKAAIWTGSES